MIESIKHLSSGDSFDRGALPIKKARESDRARADSETSGAFLRDTEIRRSLVRQAVGQRYLGLQRLRRDV